MDGCATGNAQCQQRHELDARSVIVAATAPMSHMQRDPCFHVAKGPRRSDTQDMQCLLGEKANASTSTNVIIDVDGIDQETKPLDCQIRRPER
jgi:hypothetical protein